MTTKIIRVFPRRTSHTPTDSMVFIGDPPLDRPQADEVHVSCTFTWDKRLAERLREAWSQYYPIVKVGGPAYDDSGNGFKPGVYLREGITTTSRGCNNQCSWCLVPEREGKIRELTIYPGYIIQDNNLLQCSRSHIDKVFDMLQKQRHIEFSGGLDARLITDYIADRIRGLSVSQIFLAADTEESIKPLRRAVKKLQIARAKKRIRCYALLKYNPEETFEHALSRMLAIYDSGCYPSAQLYQPPGKYIEYPREWKKFMRVFQRPAATYGYITRLLKNIQDGDV